MTTGVLGAFVTNLDDRLMTPHHECGDDGEHDDDDPVCCHYHCQLPRGGGTPYAHSDVCGNERKNKQQHRPEHTTKPHIKMQRRIRTSCEVAVFHSKHVRVFVPASPSAAYWNTPLLDTRWRGYECAQRPNTVTHPTTTATTS
jgi:hypothetical protein